MRSFPKAKEAFSEGEKVSFGVHRLHVGDAREVLASFPEASVHLVVTSPPYWTLKRYEDTPGQLGHIEDYEAFLDELDRVWREVFRLLVPGGRLVIVVGDVAVARRRFGRHLVFPSTPTSRCAAASSGLITSTPSSGTSTPTPASEVEGRGVFLGKPYEPGAIIKTEIEYILMQRKPGGYRKPTQEQREKSRLPKEDFHRFFRQIWDDIPGESTKDHPAPFPLELAERLVRMFSFVGDVVLDPFAGTGTTLIAAARWGRRALGVELVPRYAQLAKERFAREVPGFSLEVLDGATHPRR